MTIGDVTRTQAGAIDAEELLAAAHSIGSLLRERAAEGEAQRRPTDAAMTLNVTRTAMSASTWIRNNVLGLVAIARKARLVRRQKTARRVRAIARVSDVAGNSARISKQLRIDVKRRR